MKFKKFGLCPKFQKSVLRNRVNFGRNLHGRFSDVKKKKQPEAASFSHYFTSLAFRETGLPEVGYNRSLHYQSRSGHLLLASDSRQSQVTLSHSLYPG